MTTSYAFSARNQQLSESQPGGVEHAYTYDRADTEIEYVSVSDSRVKKLIRAKGSSLERSRSYEWNPTADTCENPALKDKDGNDVEADPTRSTDPRGNQTIYCADSDGRIRRVKDPLGHRHDTEYDAQSNVVKATNARSQSTKGVFDDRDLEQSQSPEGAITKFTYNSESGHLPASVENPQGNTLSYGYDSQGNLTSTTAKGSGSAPEERQNELRYNKQGMDEDQRTGPRRHASLLNRGRGRRGRGGLRDLEAPHHRLPL